MTKPLQVEELTPEVCRQYHTQLEYALKTMRTLVEPENYATGRGKSPEQLITERHGLGLDPYIPDYALDKIKKECRS